MTDVEILAVEEVVCKSEFNGTAFLIATIVIGIVCGIIIFFIAHSPYCSWDEAITVGFWTFIASVSAAGIIIALVFPANVAYESQYKVTVSDEISMNEFFEHYEIVDQEGKIYTVREREQVGAE